MTYEDACMESVKSKYWLEIYQIITNDNDPNDTSLSNVNTRDKIIQVIPEEQVRAEANDVTVDTLIVSPQSNLIEDLINKVTNLTKNVKNKNDIIDEVKNLTINVGKDNDLSTKSQT